MDRSRTKFLKVHVYNTFFYSTLCQGGYSKVRKWSKKVILQVLKKSLIHSPRIKL